MKSKITRIPPNEVDSIKFNEAKTIIKKDIATLESLGENAQVDFFINTNFKYINKDKIMPLLILSEFKGAWKDHVRKETKPPSKFGLTGSCTISSNEEGKVLQKENQSIKLLAILSIRVNFCLVMFN